MAPRHCLGGTSTPAGDQASTALSTSVLERTPVLHRVIHSRYPQRPVRSPRISLSTWGTTPPLRRGQAHFACLSSALLEVLPAGVSRRGDLPMGFPPLNSAVSGLLSMAGASHDEATGSRENWFATPRRRAAVAARRCTGQEMAEERSSEGQIMELAATIPSCYPQRYPQPAVARPSGDHRDIHSGSTEHLRSQQRRFRRGGADGSVRSARRASPFGRMHSVMSPPTLPSAR
jgi:hypothetical protein